MAGFLENFAGGKADSPRMAAWILCGAAAGSGALFEETAEGRQLICRDDGFSPETAERIRGLAPGMSGIHENGEEKIFLEWIPGRKKLVICGGGHVAQSVIRLCAGLGFEITAIEDREEYAGKAREAGAHRVLCQPFGAALDGIAGDLSTAFVIMTREHAHDMECLRRILAKPFAYVGMMGSRSRTEQVRRQILAEGFDPGKADRLRMPIGLPIGARTPEEIAVSVAAELIREMNAAAPGEGFPAGMPETLAAKPRGVLAMIVEKHGEAPRKPGTKMLVKDDGSLLGTIGGGSAEAEILQIAGKMIREDCRESRLVQISMKKGTMYCGGEITVFLMPTGEKGDDGE